MSNTTKRRPLFILTSHCKSNVHCKTCRLKEGGRSWRTSLEKFYELPMNSVDFDCPYSKPWINDNPLESNLSQSNESLPAPKLIRNQERNLTREGEINVKRKGCGCSRGTI